MNVLGIELELDLFDADQLEIFEKECRRVYDRIRENGQYKGKSTADAIRYQCRIVDDFFDTLFGGGTAKKIFKGKSNIRDHMEAFAIVTNEAEKSGTEFSGLIEQYSPNRAERRQQQRQGPRNYQRNYAVYNGKNGGKRNR